MHAGDQDGFDDGGLFSRVALRRGAVLVGIAVVIGAFLVSMNGGGGGRPDGSIDPAAAGSSTTLSAEGSVDGNLPSPSGGPGSATSVVVAAPGVNTTVAIGAQTPIVSAPPASALTAPDTSSTTVKATPATGSTTVTAKAPAAQQSGPAGISVLVLNAGAVKGTAAKEASALATAGYTVLPARNADTLLKSAILYTAGHEADAKAVATSLKVRNTALVRALNPADPPVSSLGDAEVIVVLGNDGLIAGG